MLQTHDLIIQMMQLYESGTNDCNTLERGLYRIIEDIPDTMVRRIRLILANRNPKINDIRFSIVKEAIQEDLANFSFDQDPEGHCIICGSINTILDDHGWQSQNFTWELEDKIWLDNLIEAIQRKANNTIHIDGINKKRKSIDD